MRVEKSMKPIVPTFQGQIHITRIVLCRKLSPKLMHKTRGMGAFEGLKEDMLYLLNKPLNELLEDEKLLNYKYHYFLIRLKLFRE